METDILYAVLTIAIGIVAAGIAYGAVQRLKKRAERTTSHFDDILLSSLGKPLVVTILAVSIYIALTHFAILPELIAGFAVELYINAFFILVGAWIISSFSYSVLHTYGNIVAKKTETDFDDRLIPVLEIAAQYLTWFVAFLLILANFSIDITPLLAGAGIAGIALALAAQEILSNFLGGIIITMDKPFRVGDRVRINDFVGEIISVGPRSTRLKTLDNQIVTIPNATVTSSIVVNFAMPDLTLKVRIPFSVAYGTDIGAVKRILLDIALQAAEKTPWVLTDPAPSVYFLEFGESSLNGQLILWTNEYGFAWDVQDYINCQIDERFRKEGIEIPFRQVDIRMRDRGVR